MSVKKYQVFISSTYEDLKEERKAVEQTIISAGDFPLGMESFPAADEDQFEFIKTILNECDYYILIVAGKYGTIASDGISYTEKEYNYAVKIGIPVLVMLRENRDKLSADCTEVTSARRKKLEQFAKTISSGRMHKKWETTDGLKLVVLQALHDAKAKIKRPGWVRGDQAATTEMLNRTITLQEENQKLKAKLAAVKPKSVEIKNLSGLDRKIEFKGSCTTGYIQDIVNHSIKISTNLGEIYELLAPHLLSVIEDGQVSELIAQTICQRHGLYSEGKYFKTNDELFQTIKIQFRALDLINLYKDLTGLHWSITELGKQEMYRRRVLRDE